jgi:hypothetical protein
MKLIAIVNNLPTDLAKYAWITANTYEGELWFYGAWYTEAEAREQAREIGGVALKIEG